MKSFLIVLGIIVLLVILVIVGNALRWFGGAIEVAHEEFSAKALLQKYEWFKDTSASLNKKQADIKIYDSRIKQMEEDYKDASRKDWDRTDKEQMSIWQTELAGVKASYNSLAAEYNSQMVKFNWRFCNKGTLPEGATEPLPREFAPYIEN